MITGKVLEEWSHMRLRASSNMTLLDAMGSDGSGRDGDSLHEAQADLSFPSQRWSSLMTYLVNPIRQHARADIFVCADHIPAGRRPEEIKYVFAFDATNQHTRVRGCWQRVGEGYDFYVKVRPDFVFLGSNLDWTSLRSDRLYSRFRYVGGLTGVTSEHMSWEICTSECHCKDHTGFANDDMIWVAHGSLMDRVTAFRNGDAMSKPMTWLCRGNGRKGLWTEEQWSLSLLAQGVLTSPLAVTGYPTSTQHNHSRANICHDRSQPSTFRVYEKKCGISMSIEKFYERQYCSKDMLKINADSFARGCAGQVPRLINNIKRAAMELCERDGLQKCCDLHWNADPIVAITEGEASECDGAW